MRKNTEKERTQKNFYMRRRLTTFLIEFSIFFIVFYQLNRGKFTQYDLYLPNKIKLQNLKVEIQNAEDKNFLT
jgi:hypothetical protein